MALATKQPSTQQPMQRIWKTPNSKALWVWLAISLFIYGVVSAWYFVGLKTQQYPGPYVDPFRLIGIVSYALVLVVVAYTLRRRFVRNLPWKVQDWLWVHIWLGIVSVLVAFQHENYMYILNNFYYSTGIFTEGLGGMSALIFLILLVVSGIVGRLLDIWQARIIAHESNSNGVGIEQAVHERLHEISLSVERLSAGKSEAFKHYCTQVLNANIPFPSQPPALPLHEQNDFQRVWDILMEHAQLTRSLRRQQRAHLVILSWRYFHIPLAIVGFLIISIHSLLEIAKLILQATGHM